MYLEPADLLTVEVLYAEVMHKNTLVLIIHIWVFLMFVMSVIFWMSAVEKLNIVRLIQSIS